MFDGRDGLDSHKEVGRCRVSETERVAIVTRTICESGYRTLMTGSFRL
jgi:hypothetical protein